MTLGEMEQVVRTNPFSRQVIDKTNCRIQNTALSTTIFQVPLVLVWMFITTSFHPRSDTQRSFIPTGCALLIVPLIPL